ncbi:MAG TPA: bifunctional phosphopantothenoylcysteine decarboxylase/phosphopantothenate--cysteine ligase CoaBC [Pyrinomonadaceae bacterium]|nr:bifunctional phosphopantothenoylcysteine decarboxylase/phosphopantothenate--cysteine ligase CoaBC [Pyrinomonadaceae bacterium]
MVKFKVGLGVSGGIAAYKAVEVMRLLQKSGCDVSVAMTRHATEFVQPLTFKALTDKYVIVDDYDPQNPDPIAHINFSQNIDLLLIVPATANIIAKFANGVADDFLSSTYLASNAPVLIAPAMNTTMWEQPATQRNIEQLKKDGVLFVEPVAGELACKTVGTGKLEDVENIVAQAMALLTAETRSRRESEPGAVATGFPVDEDAIAVTTKQHETARNKNDDATPHSAFRIPHSKDLIGERFLITVGGTREAIDPVRFISNHSSGKMGFAVAEAAANRGADVTVVTGITNVSPPTGVKVITAISADEMHKAVMSELPDSTVFVGAAAVADYRPANIADAKIKKDGRDAMTLELVKTPDILADVAKNRSKGMLVVGFAAETNDLVGYARSKMEKKGLDMVVANNITAKGAGFNTDTNIATILTRNGAAPVELPLMTKREMADRILDRIIELRESSR